ncbi:hypothetical protein EJB05_24885, partial [Eragrostis curvula]
MGHKGKMTSVDFVDRRARPFNPKDVRATIELLDMCIKALQNKRCSTREAALEALAGALESLPPPDELDSRCFNIFSIYGVCIKEGIMAEPFPLLTRTIQGQCVAHDDAPTMVAALECLAAVTFARERSMTAVWDVIISPR